MKSLPTIGALTLVTVTIGAVFVVSAGGADDDEGSASQSTATTEIERKDLVETEEVDGTLGFADSRTVIGRLSGTVTWAAAEGSRVRTNHKLFEVNGKGVYLLDGTYPAYRTLRAGRRGEDVEQLERNLRQLGLDDDKEMTVDGEWDEGTTQAVQRWQRRKGLADDGSIELGRVVFAPGTRRIGEHLIEIGWSTSSGGQAAGASGSSGGQPAATGGATTAAATGSSSSATVATEMITTTSTRRIVTVELETTKSRLAERGADVTVEMPDGDDAEGTITAVGSVATREENSDGSTGDATIELTIELRGRGKDAIDQAPVDVSLEQQRAEDVLTVPVTALLSQSGGGFAVEVVEAEGRRLVPVETGLYTEGDVEIEGEGLEPGMTVTDARV